MAMEESKFWSIIADAREENELEEGDSYDLVDQLEARLASMEDEEVAAFQQQMLEQYCQAFDYRLLAAAYVIVGDNCDEDDQHGLRGWLIAQGEEFFRKTLADPDWLADASIVRNRVYLPEILGVASDVYQQSTGELPPADPNFQLPSSPRGEELELTDLPRWLPNLCAEWSFSIEGEEEEDAPLDAVEAMLAQVDAHVQQAAEAEANADPDDATR